MSVLVLYLSEWPWILLMMLAIYIAFEICRFPDLTPEAAFGAGMTSLYFAAMHAPGFASRIPVLLLVGVLAIVLLSGATWCLAWARLPALFAGLLVTLAAYSINYWLNGSQTAQGLALSEWIPGWAVLHNLNLSESATVWFGLTALLACVAVIAVFRTRGGNALILARCTPDPAVCASLHLRPQLALFLGMLLYNGIGFIAGVGFGLQNSFSGISFIAAITPGLAGMFMVRAVKMHAGAPSIRSRPFLQGFMGRLLRWADSTTLVIVALLVISLGVTLMRFAVRSAAGPGMLNALTAAGIGLIWLLLAGVASIMGKQVIGTGDGAST